MYSINSSPTFCLILVPQFDSSTFKDSDDLVPSPARSGVANIRSMISLKNIAGRNIFRFWLYEIQLGRSRSEAQDLVYMRWCLCQFPRPVYHEHGLGQSFLGPVGRRRELKTSSTVPTDHTTPSKACWIAVAQRISSASDLLYLSPALSSHYWQGSLKTRSFIFGVGPEPLWGRAYRFPPM